MLQSRRCNKLMKVDDFLLAYRLCASSIISFTVLYTRNCRRKYTKIT